MEQSLFVFAATKICSTVFCLLLNELLSVPSGKFGVCGGED